MSGKAFLSCVAIAASLPLLAMGPTLDQATGDMLAVRALQSRPKVVIVMATDFAFEMPVSIPAGVTTFEMRDRGKMQHHLSIVRLDSGKTTADGLAALIKAGRGVRPSWMHPVGGPNAPMPGESSIATLSLEPGDYMAFCEVPGPDAVRHYMKGMVKGFSVTPSSKRADMPAADLAIVLVDYDFVLSHPLVRGHHVIAVTNSSTQPHMMAIKRFPIDYPPGQGVKDIIAWASDPKGELGPVGAGGVTEIAPGEQAVMQRDFEPGMYLLICFSADATDGKPHFRHGMAKEIIVE
ncbi:MAG: hypothetical protein M3Y05_09205 [Gemmatimonadota bacterium]|nr:hypothetical protein [Gemmatimonadota bacterium]